MLLACAFLTFFFLLWTFFTTTLTHSLTRLGETLSQNALSGSYGFFYLPLHFLFFKRRRFELLIFSSTLSENLARLLFAGVAVYCFVFNSASLLNFISALVILLILMLLIGDFFPKILSIQNPQKALRFCLLPASVFLYLSFPLCFAFIKIADIALRKKGQDAEPIEEMRETIVKILQPLAVTGKLTATDKSLIKSVIQFKDLIVREAMIPRVDLFSLPATTTIREAAYLLAKEGYSRVPVYRGSIDNCIGILMYKDVLEIYMECERKLKDWSQLNATIETCVKTVFYTPETTKVASLLQEFRTKQTHIAIVIDEYGGTAGVVTIEDALEEIVGDIEDEYDVEEEVLYTAGPGGDSWIVDARMNVKDAEDTFGITIPQEGDYDTLGGYLFHKSGSIPEKGLVLHHDDFDLEVISTTGRSVEKVRITLVKKEEE